MLSNEQVEQFQNQGVLTLEKLFPESSLATLRQAAAQIVDEFDIDRHRTVFSTQDRDRGRDDYFFDSAEAVHCFLEEDALSPDGQLTQPKHRAINKIGHAMHDRIPAFEHFCRLPEIGQLLRDLGYMDPQLWQTMYIYKQPRIGGEVRWHQDASYLVSEPATVTGLWLALEDATLDNGCLWVQPGEHRSPVRELYTVDWAQRSGALASIDATPWTQSKGMPLEVPAGSLVIFSDHLPHYSAPNRSAKSRQAFTMHVAEADSVWSENNWLQRRSLPPFQL